MTIFFWTKDILTGFLGYSLGFFSAETKFKPFDLEDLLDLAVSVPKFK